MKIALIAPILFDLGLYTIAPQLKAKGFQVKLLFIPDLMNDYNGLLSWSKMEKIKIFVEDSNLIGVNAFSENYIKISNLVDFLKQKIDTPIVWGGIHATLNPQDCLKYADFVCIGEGEEAIVELAHRINLNEDTDDIKNILSPSRYSKKATLRPPIDLDRLEPFCYDLSYQYILEGSRIRNIRENDFKGTFLTYSSRGCPFRCSYCCNGLLYQNVYKGQKYCRERKIDNIFIELKDIKRQFSSCRVIWFNEADFLAGKADESIDIFSKRYKQEIKIPFGIWTNPISISDRKIKMLKDAGLSYANIGTVNANKQIQNEIYKRNVAPNHYIKAGEILKKYEVSTEYDFILCNPYENDEHIINTINFLCSLPKPFRTVIYSLTYFPGTELYDRVLKDGFIKPSEEIQSYTKAAYKVWKYKGNHVYLNGVASLMRGMAREKFFLRFDKYGLLPKPLLKFLISKPLVNFFKHSLFRAIVFPLIGSIIQIMYISAVRLRRLHMSLHQ